ncbi:MAG TPA: glycosyltransferase family 4 protein [Woeseiaceae bacterium]
MSRTVVVVSQVLPADVRHQLRALADGRLLRKAFTGYAYQPNRWMERAGQRLDSILGTKLTASLSRRPVIAGVPAASVRMAWVAEAVGALLLRRLGRRNLSAAYQDWTQTRLSFLASRHIRSADKVAVAREYDALEIFQQAAKIGVHRVYQLPTPHYQTVDRILRQELDLFPDTDLQKSHDWSVAPQRIERKNGELALASQVLVPSLFVKRSLMQAGISEDKICLLPFGTEAEWNVDDAPPKDPNLFLHVGQLSIRKGTHRLLNAWKRLGAYRNCELRLIGSMHLPKRFLAEFAGVYNYIGRLPRPSLRSHYAVASCFVLPALAEGFAVVILESMSCGTPVVASRNSGAEGFICDGQEGLLHDAQDDDQLCEALESMLTHPQRRLEMGHNCLLKARSWTWENYRAAFLALIQDSISGAKKVNHQSFAELIAC